MEYSARQLSSVHHVVLELAGCMLAFCGMPPAGVARSGA